MTRAAWLLSWAALAAGVGKFASASDGMWTEAQSTATKRSAEGMKLIGEKRFPEATALFAEAASLDPAEPGHWSNLGMAQFSQGMFLESSKAYSKGLAIDPGHEMLLTNLEKLKAARGLGGDAPAKSAPIELSGDVVHGVSSDEVSNLLSDANVVSSLTNDAIDLAETGDMVGALELFRQATAKAPKSGKAWENIGVTFLRLGRLEEARSALEVARDLLPASETSIRENLSALDEHEEFARKPPVKAHGARIEPSAQSTFGEDAADSLTAKAIKLVTESNDLQGALGLFEQAVEENPGNYQMWENLGVRSHLHLLTAPIHHGPSPLTFFIAIAGNPDATGPHGRGSCVI